MFEQNRSICSWKSYYCVLKAYILESLDKKRPQFSKLAACDPIMHLNFGERLSYFHAFTLTLSSIIKESLLFNTITKTTRYPYLFTDCDLDCFLANGWYDFTAYIAQKHVHFRFWSACQMYTLPGPVNVVSQVHAGIK